MLRNFFELQFYKSFTIIEGMNVTFSYSWRLKIHYFRLDNWEQSMYWNIIVICLSQVVLLYLSCIQLLWQAIVVILDTVWQFGSTHYICNSQGALVGGGTKWTIQIRNYGKIKCPNSVKVQKCRCFFEHLVQNLTKLIITIVDWQHTFLLFVIFHIY